MIENIPILYEDPNITITECYILIKKYYQPLMTSKTIMFQEMKTITIEDAKNVNNSWGINSHFLNNWFSYDKERKNKTKFISIEIKGSRVKPAITPDDVDKAFTVLRNHFETLDRKSVMFISNRDKQTELHQAQAHEMMKQQLESEVTQEELKEKAKNNVEMKLETSEQQLNDKKEVKVEDIE